jgi:Phage portal protein
VGLLDRVAAQLPTSEARSSIDQWVGEYLIPASWQSFQYGGQTYPVGVNTSMQPVRAQEISQDLPGFMAAVRRCPPAFAAEMVRALVLSQARFTFRNKPGAPRTPRRPWTSSALAPLEQPWTNGTTADLVSRMEWHAGIAGNSYVTNWQPGRLRVLRPDWVAIVYGSQREPDDPAHALDGDVIGYVYQNGGVFSAGEPRILTPDTVSHWAPQPDPLNAGIGMSWITPAVREIQGDVLATQHKIRFFENSATPNLVVKGLQASSPEQFNELVDMLEQQHSGVRNAYKTLYLSNGADATVVGANLQQIDFKATQGTGETRLSMLSRVHPVILGASEGLQASAMSAGNFGPARRIWSDTWILPTLQGLCAALAPLIRIPSDSELWFDTVDMPIMREDALQAAQIMEIEAATIGALIQTGFTPESAVAATTSKDSGLLDHTGLVSVQLQPAGSDGAQKTMQPGQPGAGQPGHKGAFPTVPMPRTPRLPRVPLQTNSAAQDDEDEDRDVSKLEYGQGHALWEYWTAGKGLARWIKAAHKWTTLHRLLIEEGVPAHEADGLATNIINHVLPGYMKQAHK